MKVTKRIGHNMPHMIVVNKSGVLVLHNVSKGQPTKKLNHTSRVLITKKHRRSQGGPWPP